MRAQEQLKETLLKERERIKNKMNLTETEESFKSNIAELSVVDNHPADIGSENFEISKDLSLKEKKLYLLDRIERALNKMEKGNYGSCEKCGESIPTDRLLAVPYTLFCFSCQEIQENQQPDERPVEEDVLAPSFYDYEDAWQDDKEENDDKYVDTDKISNEDYKKQF